MIREFLGDLKYYASAENTQSRGTYIIIIALLVVLAIAILSGIVATIIYAAAGNFQVLPLLITVICLAISIGLVIWLYRS